MLAVAVLLTGCRGDIVVGADIDADGGATILLEVGVDAAMLAELDALGIDATGELEAAVATEPDWEVERQVDDGGLRVTATRAVDGVAEIGPSLAALSEGLDAADPAIRLDLEVTRDDDGVVALRGQGRFEPPGRPAASLDDEPLGPDADDLAAATAEAIDASFVMRLPGEVATHDASVRDGRELRWDLPVGEDVAFNARSQAPGWWALVPLAVWVGAGSALLALLVGLVWWLGRRRGGATTSTD